MLFALLPALPSLALAVDPEPAVLGWCDPDFGSGGGYGTFVCNCLDEDRDGPYWDDSLSELWPDVVTDPSPSSETEHESADESNSCYDVLGATLAVPVGHRMEIAQQLQHRADNMASNKTTTTRKWWWAREGSPGALHDELMSSEQGVCVVDGLPELILQWVPELGKWDVLEPQTAGGGPPILRDQLLTTQTPVYAVAGGNGILSQATNLYVYFADGSVWQLHGPHFGGMWTPP
jgi:hypothetical protein